jgi:hypothetical protein
VTPTRRTVLSAAALGLATPALATAERAVERWGVHEVVLQGPSGGNPFVDVTLSARFTSGGRTIHVPGFYDGDGLYRIRFSPPETGRWTWLTTSNVVALEGRSGVLVAMSPTGGNHGPLQVVSGYHFAHADGTPFRQIGTTCYAWAQQSEARCAETLATLKASPFNKIRMCVFPNVAAEPIHPFELTGAGERDWDPTRFNPAYFRRFEDRVARLQAIGVQADVIIFHPYDGKRGFSDMSRADDERYVRYLIARLSAYRNVWWSLANEYDLIKSKSMDDIDHLLRLIRQEDPHGRLRSIHNLRELYDNAKPWITHSSIQNGSAVLDDRTAETYRSVWKKPVVFDEVLYEGNIDQRWGNLSGEQMVMRFWHGLIAGTYVGHSETLTPDDSGAANSWLGKGGKLFGSSMPRLAFLKRIMEEGPAPGIDPIDKWWEQHLGGREGQYYLRYFGETAPISWALNLPRNGLGGGERFRVDVLDTWNMTITPVEGAFTMAKKDTYFFHDPARPSVPLPGRPWMAVRMLRL